MAAVLTFSLQSGSIGNSIYVEAGDVRLLFDAGINGEKARRRMAARGRDMHDVTALIVSHEHDDHIRCAGVFHRKFHMPIYATPRTLGAEHCPLGPLNDVRYFAAGQTLEFGDVRVFTIPTPHDAADPVAFIIEHEGRRLGILTDLGHPFAALQDALGDLDAAYLESNYDRAMLLAGSYPEGLKRRIRGPRGHLSNDESAALSRRGTGPRLKWVALAHLSECNNTPDLALHAHRQQVGWMLDVRLASRHQVSPAWTV